MSKRKKQNSYIITSQQLFSFNKPKFNGYAGGYGSHGDKKYNRRKAKKDLNQDLSLY